MLSTDQIPVLVAVGASALALSSMLWSLRVTDGHRGAANRFRQRAGEFEEKLARADSIFGAHHVVLPPRYSIFWRSLTPSYPPITVFFAPQVRVHKKAAPITVFSHKR